MRNCLALLEALFAQNVLSSSLLICSKFCSFMIEKAMTTFLMHIVDMCLLLLAFITENSSLEPLLECLFTQIHVDWS